MLKEELDQRVLDLLASRYWNKPVTNLSATPPEPDSLATLPTSDPDSLYWHRKLDASTSALTKLGIGRLATILRTLSRHMLTALLHKVHSPHIPSPDKPSPKPQAGS